MRISHDMEANLNCILKYSSSFIARPQQRPLLLQNFYTKPCSDSGRIAEVWNYLLINRLGGGGLYLGHAYNITINSNAKIGRNCNIHKGVVIGQANRGSRKGYPTIGDRVWIGINSAIVGNVNIGDDVMIAPNSFVNVDIPSHSVVFGNPCIIKHRDWATEEYVNNFVK